VIQGNNDDYILKVGMLASAAISAIASNDGPHFTEK
jgi:hypothetical protein